MIKYDALGNKEWTQQFGGPGQDTGGAVVVDSADSIYVAGHTDGVLDGQPWAGD